MIRLWKDKKNDNVADQMNVNEKNTEQNGVCWKWSI